MLRLAVFLLVCAAVRAREMECDKFSKNRFCWNSTTHQNPICLICEIKNQQLFESDEVIYLNHPHNYFDAVRFSGGNMTKMPNLIQIKDNKDILGVKLLGTKIPVLNSQFFGNAGENWTSFQYYSDNNLTVKAFAFQNCKSLESLVLKSNKSSSIFEPDAFRGLHKLIWLRLSKNDLSLMLTDWFQDLANLDLLSLDKNKLAEIPDNAFKSLTKLTKLDLDRNRIEIITRNMFKHNAKLQRIDLQFNRISQIQSGSFAHLSQLTELNLEYNQCVSKEFINKTSDEIAERLTDCYPYTCVIPQIPNGIIVSIDDNSTQLPGELFDGSGSVKVNCNSTFTQIHDIANETTNRCLEGNWEDQQWPTCQSK